MVLSVLWFEVWRNFYARTCASFPPWWDQRRCLAVLLEDVWKFDRYLCQGLSTARTWDMRTFSRLCQATWCRRDFPGLGCYLHAVVSTVALRDSEPEVMALRMKWDRTLMHSGGNSCCSNNVLGSHLRNVDSTMQGLTIRHVQLIFALFELARCLRAKYVTGILLSCSINMYFARLGFLFYSLHNLYLKSGGVTLKIYTWNRATISRESYSFSSIRLAWYYITTEIMIKIVW